MVELGLCSQLKYKEKKVGSSNDETVGDRCGLTEETEDIENWKEEAYQTDTESQLDMQDEANTSQWMKQADLESERMMHGKEQDGHEERSSLKDQHDVLLVAVDVDLSEDNSYKFGFLQNGSKGRVELDGG
jgi:hypothetical protein